MKITVKTLSGETIPFEVEASDTVLSIPHPSIGVSNQAQDCGGEGVRALAAEVTAQGRTHPG